jgi:hypothetical protein
MTATGHQFEDSIDQLAAMIEGAQQMAEAGQIVELDVLALKIAVLTDALAGKDDVERPNPLLPRLEHLVEALNHLELTLRKRNVNLALDLEQADRRLRAQVAYRSERSES